MDHSGLHPLEQCWETDRVTKWPTLSYIIFLTLNILHATRLHFLEEQGEKLFVSDISTWNHRSLYQRPVLNQNWSWATAESSLIHIPSVVLLIHQTNYFLKLSFGVKIMAKFHANFSVRVNFLLSLTLDCNGWTIKKWFFSIFSSRLTCEPPVTAAYFTVERIKKCLSLKYTMLTFKSK